MKNRLGVEQSPINLSQSFAQKNSLTGIQFHYSNSQLIDVKHTGHTVKCWPSETNYIIVDGQRYSLVEFHFHTPSEHAVDLQLYPAEVHFVHKSPTDQHAVIGVFLQQGESFCQAVAKVMVQVPAEVKDVNLLEFFPEMQTLYHYDGSLTTPPYTEGVKWYVFDTPVIVSSEQMERVKKIIGQENSRKIQPLGRRTLRYSE